MEAGADVSLVLDDARQPGAVEDDHAASLEPDQALLGELTPEGHPFHRAARRPATANALLEEIRRLQRRGLSPDQLEQQIKAQAKAFADLGVIQKDVSGDIGKYWDGSFVANAQKK